MNAHKTRQKAIIGGFISIGLIIINQAIIQYFLFQKTEDSFLINIAGEQRMLSQRLNTAFYKFENNQISLDQLKKIHEEWERKMHIVLKITQKNNIFLSNVKILQKIKDIMFVFQYTKFCIIKLSKKENNDMKSLNNQLDFFLINMDKIVKDLEQNSVNKLTMIILLEVFLAIISIIITILKVKHIYFPIINKLVELNKQLCEQNKCIYAIYNSSVDASTFIDKNFIIRYNNQSAKNLTKKIFGKEAKIGDKSLDFFIDEYKQEFQNYYYEVLKGNIITTEKKFENTYWKIDIFPVYDIEKYLVGIALNIKDITQQKIYELKILQQNEILKDIAWEQSHEVRGPVANILGLVNLLRNDEHSVEEIDIYLDYLQVATEKLDAIIHSIVNKINQNDEN
ncbi:MAG: PAS domain S-box protein [Bacteroidetes bacterium]|nr:MAG: PAS domain S-box protein [Bacteroidota bacterium]